MKKILQAEDKDTFTPALFEATEYGPIAAYGEFAISHARSSGSNDVVLDGILAAIKWIFLYIPGVAAVHMMMVGFVIIFYTQNWSSEFLSVQLLGLSIISMFMIMLGIGKLRDLRYLKVVVSVFAASAAFALLFAILIGFAPGNYFGIYIAVTLSATLLLGYLTKKDIDRQLALSVDQDGN